MKKLINGKVIDIKNIELFEKCFEGLALNNMAYSNIDDTLKSDSAFVNDCINFYNKALNSLPFPLYAIESNCKYAVLANYIKANVNGIENENIYVKNALYININDSIRLKIVFRTWGIEKNDSKPKDALSIDMDQFKNEIEYNELNWCLEKLLNNEKLSTYYTTFMKDFMIACKQEMIMKWELKNILNFAYYAPEIQINENRILSPEKKYEYFLDVYCTGKQKTKDKVLNIVIGDTTRVETKAKMVRIYDFEVYGKSIDEDESKNSNNKLERKNVEGMSNVFSAILDAGMADDIVEDIKYKGLIVGDKIVYEIKNKVYLADLDKYSSGGLLIAVSCSIYSYEGNKVYLKNVTKMPSGANKISIFSYDILASKGRLCSIKFEA